MDARVPGMPMGALEDQVPSAAPFLPSLAGIDTAAIPRSKPRQVVEMTDGDSLDLKAGLVRHVVEGRTFVMYGYNGQIPGPLIKVRQRSRVVVNFTNEIELPTTVHWHGLRLDNPFDGVPGVTQEAVLTGESFRYELRFPDAGIYWYHPHVREDAQQDLGLYGNMLVEAPETDYYGPANRQEVLVLDDLLVDDLGLVPWGAEAATHALMGRWGNVLLVNGEPGYGLTVNRGDVVRFELTNVANARTFNLGFAGARMKLVATDVSRYQKEQWIQSVVISPAERYVIDVLFEEPGEHPITNRIQAVNHFLGDFLPLVDTLGTVTVLPESTEADHARAFVELRDYPDVSSDIERFRPHFDRPVDKEIVLTLEVGALHTSILTMMTVDTFYVPPLEWNDAMPMMNWLSTAREVTWVLHEPETGRKNMDIGWTFHEGDVVKIRIHNEPRSFHPMQHPIHIHGQRFLVLEQDGVVNTNMAWKDTALVPVGSTVDFLVDMSNPGDWMMHCHIAEHLSAGMMLRFTVEPKVVGQD